MSADVLGSRAFSPVKNDILGNVKVQEDTPLLPTQHNAPPLPTASRFHTLQGYTNTTCHQKLRERQLAAPAESETLQELVVNELKTKSHKATEGLLWLTRALEFTCIALSQNVASSTEELSDSFRNAYGVTLKPHHSFVIKPIFSAAMSACPYRKDFYAKLGDDVTKVMEQLRAYLAALDKIVGILKGFLETKEAKW
jgi:hypothetical protein